MEAAQEDFPSSVVAGMKVEESASFKTTFEDRESLVNSISLLPAECRLFQKDFYQIYASEEQKSRYAIQYEGMDKVFYDYGEFFVYYTRFYNYNRFLKVDIVMPPPIQENYYNMVMSYLELKKDYI